MAGCSFYWKKSYSGSAVYSLGKTQTITLFTKEVLVLKKEEAEPIESDLIPIDSDEEDD